MNDDKPILLTPDEAIAMLPEGEWIHTFRNPGVNLLIGADWDRDDLLVAIRCSCSRQVGGPMCCGMNHGLVIWHDKRQLYIECRKGIDYEQIPKPIGVTE